MAYRYNKEQHKLMNSVMLEAYKKLNDSGLFLDGVPPSAHTASWAMMYMLKPGSIAKSGADKRARDSINFTGNTRND